MPIGIFNGNSRHLQYARELEEEARAERIRFKEQWRTALDRLKQFDPDWEEWYDSRPEQTAGEMLPVMEERIIWMENAMETLVRDTKAGVDVDAFLLLMDVCATDSRNASEHEPEFGSAEWYASLPMIDPETLEEYHA